MLIRKDKDAAEDIRGYAKATQRTMVRQFIIDDERGLAGLLKFLDEPPDNIEAVAVEWGRLAFVLPVRDRALPQALRAALGREPLPDDEGWPGLVSRELARFPALQARLGIAAGHLAEVVAREKYLAVIQHYAGKAKDGALDLRITAGAYGWFQVTETLRWVRDRAPLLAPDKRLALLRDFAPLLVLLTQQQEDTQARRADLSAVRADAAAEASAAEREALRAEALRAHHAGAPLSQEELLDLALSKAEALAESEQGPPTPAAKADAKARKTPRARAVH